jgi:16S rRNA (cytosine1402-N4)-methyltransferase
MYIHQPVLVREILEYLECSEARVSGAGFQPAIYVDATVGEGGHAEQILEESSPAGRLIGIDLDEHILQKAAIRLERFGSRVKLVRDNFKNIKEILKELGLSQIDGFLADLGISSFHLERQEPAGSSAGHSGGSGRGFSFQNNDEPLDMRLDQRNPLTAAMIVNESTETELASIIWEYGEERWSRRIARAICSYREKEVISTTGQLAQIVRSAIPAKFRFRRSARHSFASPPPGRDSLRQGDGRMRGRVRSSGGTGNIDPATKTFQALRIAVNQELAGLDQAIRDAVDALKPGARICVISFHSLEDRIVKRCFRSLSRAPEESVAVPQMPSSATGRSSGIVKVLTPKPVMATQEEIEANVRSRSAKLRVAEKVEGKRER